MSISLTSILHFNWSSITICVLLTSKRHAWVPIDKFYWMYIYCGYNVHMSWWFVVHILLSAMCTTYPSIIHFRLEFDDYPLPDSYRDNWKKYRLIIAVECRDTVSSTYSSQPKKKYICSCARYLILLFQYFISSRNSNAIIEFNYIGSLRMSVER